METEYSFEAFAINALILSVRLLIFDNSKDFISQ